MPARCLDHSSSMPSGTAARFPLAAPAANSALGLPLPLRSGNARSMHNTSAAVGRCAGFCCQHRSMSATTSAGHSSGTLRARHAGSSFRLIGTAEVAMEDNKQCCAGEDSWPVQQRHTARVLRLLQAQSNSRRGSHARPCTTKHSDALPLHAAEARTAGTHATSRMRPRMGTSPVASSHSRTPSDQMSAAAVHF